MIIDQVFRRYSEEQELATDVYMLRQILEFFRSAIDCRGDGAILLLSEEKILVSLLDNGFQDDAFWLFGNLFRTKSIVTKRPSLHHEIAKTQGINTSMIDEHELQFELMFENQMGGHIAGKLFEKVFVPRMDSIGSPLAFHLTIRFLEVRAAEGRGEPGELPSNYLRSAIEPHSQDQYRNDPQNFLLSLLRECWEKLYQINRTKAQMVFQQWLLVKDVFIERLRIHALRIRVEARDDATDALNVLLSQEHILWREDTRHEATLLLGAVYQALPEARNSLTCMIAAGPPTSILLNKDASELGDRLVFNTLMFLQDERLPLTPPGEEKLTNIRACHPKWNAPKYPGMTHWVESWWGGQSVSLADVRQLKPTDVPAAIKSFQPTWGNSPREFNEVIGVAIAQDPTWGTAVLDSLHEGLDTVPNGSLNPILWGIRTAVNDNSSKLDAESAITLLNVLRRLVERRSEPEEWSSLPSVMDDLIKKLSLPTSDWHDLGLYLERLFREFDFEHTEQEKPVEWMQRAINHPYGDLAQIYRDLAQNHVERLSQEEKPLLFEVHSEIFFDTTVESYAKGSRYGLCILAERMSWMEAVAPVFSKQIVGLFDWTLNAECALVAWSGYLWSRALSRNMVERFEETYFKAVQRHSEFASQELEGLAGHIAAIFWMKLASLELLYKSSAAGDSHYRQLLLRDWKSHLATAQPAIAEEFFKETLFPYWDWCRQQSFFSEESSDLERFGFWELLPFSYGQFPEASRRAIEFPPREPSIFGMFAEEIVRESTLRYPNELCQVLIALLEFDKNMIFHRNEWTVIWKTLQDTGASRLDDLADALARHGIL